MNSHAHALGAAVREFHAYSQALADTFGAHTQPLLDAQRATSLGLTGLQRQLDHSQELLEAWKREAKKIARENSARVSRLEAKNLELSKRNSRLAQRISSLLSVAGDKGQAHLALVSAALDGDAQALADTRTAAADGLEIAAETLQLCAELDALRAEVRRHSQEVAALPSKARLPKRVTRTQKPQRRFLTAKALALIHEPAPLCARQAHYWQSTARTSPHERNRN